MEGLIPIDKRTKQFAIRIVKDADPLNPLKLMWDKDAESRRMCELTMQQKYSTVNFDEVG